MPLLNKLLNCSIAKLLNQKKQLNNVTISASSFAVPDISEERLWHLPRRPADIKQCNNGFSLIEIVLSLFLILGLISILLTASGTLKHSRTSSLSTTAAKIASRQIETLRNTSFDSLPQSGNFGDSDLTNLPSGTATRSITDYQGNSEIKLVNIQVAWTENNVPKQLVMETFISKNGL